MYQPTLGRFLSRDPLSPDGIDLFHDNNRFGTALDRMRQHYGYCENDPVNRVDPSGMVPAGRAVPPPPPPPPGKKQVCGFYAWLYAGTGYVPNFAFCVDEDVYQAAIGGAADVVTCWWDCEVTTHKSIAGRVLTVTETVSGVTTGLGARVPKAPAELLGGQESKGVARSFRLASREQLKAMLRPYLGRAFARSGVVAGAKGTFVIAVVAEAGISIYCGYHCSQ